MCKFNLILLLLLFPAIANAAAPTRAYNYVAHTTIDPNQNNTNENALYGYLQAGVDTYSSGSITNDAISGIAAISYSKLNLINSITNNDISSSAAIVASKLDLTSPGPIGSVSPNTGGFTSLTGTTLFTTGNVGIGTSTASGGRLMVQGGNVGIGTVNANQALTVAGRIYSTTGGIQFPDNTVQTSASTDVNTSNVLFQYEAATEEAGGANGEVLAASNIINTATNSSYRYLRSNDTSAHTVWRTKWIKVAGVSTITIYVQHWVSANTGTVTINVGGQTGSATETATTPQWKTFTINVSGLVNGTTYDVLYQLSNNDGGVRSYGGTMIAFGS